MCEPSWPSQPPIPLHRLVDPTWRDFSQKRPTDSSNSIWRRDESGTGDKGSNVFLGHPFYFTCLHSTLSTVIQMCHHYHSQVPYKSRVVRPLGNWNVNGRPMWHFCYGCGLEPCLFRLSGNDRAVVSALVLVQY